MIKKSFMMILTVSLIFVMVGCYPNEYGMKHHFKKDNINVNYNGVKDGVEEDFNFIVEKNIEYCSKLDISQKPDMNIFIFDNQQSFLSACGGSNDKTSEHFFLYHIIYICTHTCKYGRF